jgi:tetratricopeptide (TPR) repeat protein
MSTLLLSLLGALLTTNEPSPSTNLPAPGTNLTATVPDPNDPVEREYKQLMMDDDAALAEVDDWIRENQANRAKGGGMPDDLLNARIHRRIDPVSKGYEDFLKRHPEHARAHLAYGSFLMDTHDEEGAEQHWEKARQLDPRDPAAWNNLAEMYAHHGPVEKAFEYYTKAVELAPDEPLYYHNFGNMVFVFRKDAMAFYKFDNEQQVFNKALELFQSAMKYDPTNFVLAQDVGLTYYGILPFRTEEALNLWTNTLKIADSEVEKEGVFLHLARIKLHAGRFDEARKQLTGVTNATLLELKGLLSRNIDDQEAKARATNAPPSK